MLDIHYRICQYVRIRIIIMIYGIYVEYVHVTVTVTHN